MRSRDGNRSGQRRAVLRRAHAGRFRRAILARRDERGNLRATAARRDERWNRRADGSERRGEFAGWAGERASWDGNRSGSAGMNDSGSGMVVNERDGTSCRDVHHFFNKILISLSTSNTLSRTFFAEKKGRQTVCRRQYSPERLQRIKAERGRTGGRRSPSSLMRGYARWISQVFHHEKLYFTPQF